MLVSSLCRRSALALRPEPAAPRSVDPHAARIRAWELDWLAAIQAHLIGVIDGHPAPSVIVPMLTASGVLDASGTVTPLGCRVAALLRREHYQDADTHLREFIRNANLRAGDRLLDVGCSSGVTLRSLPADIQAECTGVDLDEVALALGARIALADDRSVEFQYASSHALPMPSGSVTCVICRNALTYTHQWTTLREISRVLKPNGRFFLRVENVWYDLELLRYWRAGPRTQACRLRDFGAGAVRAATGYQFAPHGGWRGGRAFGWWRRIRADLRQLGCRVDDAAEAVSCPTFCGRSTQTILVGRKQ